MFDWSWVSFFIVITSVQEQQYSKWMAACRLASKGKTLADSSYSSEVQSIQSFLAMQKSTGNKAAQNDETINTHSLVSPRYQKKYKPKQVQIKSSCFCFSFSSSHYGSSHQILVHSTDHRF